MNDESTELVELREKIKLLQEILELKKQIAELDRPLPQLPQIPQTGSSWPWWRPDTWCGVYGETTTAGR